MREDGDPNAPSRASWSVPDCRRDDEDKRECDRAADTRALEYGEWKQARTGCARDRDADEECGKRPGKSAVSARETP
jgi:hypothetical protein